ncbi:MAG: hypothetical protein V4632_00900 [Pseudomonadota bacterium]
MKRTTSALILMTALSLGHSVPALAASQKKAPAVVNSAVQGKIMVAEPAATAGTIISVVVVLLGLACGGVILVRRFTPKTNGKPKPVPDDRSEPRS